RRIIFPSDAMLRTIGGSFVPNIFWMLIGGFKIALTGKATRRSIGLRLNRQFQTFSCLAPHARRSWRRSLLLICSKATLVTWMNCSLICEILFDMDLNSNNFQKEVES